MTPSNVRVDNIRIAPAQALGEKPDAIIDLQFNFDGPDDRIGPEIRVAVAVEYDETRPVPDLIEAGIKAALQLLGETSRLDPHQIQTDLWNFREA